MFRLPLFGLVVPFFFSFADVPTEFIPLKQSEIVPKTSKLEKLWSGGKFTEGPTPDAQGNILFTDIPKNQIMKYDHKNGKVSLFKENSNGANGLCFKDGRLYSCEGAKLQYASVAYSDPSGKKVVLVDSYMGKKLNSPNDLVITSRDDIYFTDPRYGSMKGIELGFEGIFLIRDKKIILATKETERPNGILISHDEKYLFIADNNNQPGGARTLLKFDIQEDGTLANKKILFSFKDSQRGMDGMAMDSEGNIYATAGKRKDSGIYVFSPGGKHLAFIELPDIPTNCAFGGPGEKDVLYITAQAERQPHENKSFGLFRIKLNKSRK